MEYKCPRCGNYVSEGTPNCPTCGQPFSWAVQAPVAPVAPIPQPAPQVQQPVITVQQPAVQIQQPVSQVQQPVYQVPNQPPITYAQQPLQKERKFSGKKIALIVLFSVLILANVIESFDSFIGIFKGSIFGATEGLSLLTMAEGYEFIPIIFTITAVSMLALSILSLLSELSVINPNFPYKSTAIGSIVLGALHILLIILCKIGIDKNISSASDEFFDWGVFLDVSLSFGGFIFIFFAIVSIGVPIAIMVLKGGEGK